MLTSVGQQHNECYLAPSSACSHTHINNSDAWSADVDAKEAKLEQLPSVLLCDGPIQASIAPLVYHHAHQNKYEEEGGIHFSHECLHIAPISNAST